MVFKRKQVIWVMTICFTLFIACLYILSLPRDTFASGIQVNGGSLGIEVSPTQALFSASNIAPGWQGSAKLQVSNAGQQPFSYSLSSVLNSGDQTLFSVLVLEIQDNQGNILYNDPMGNLQNLQLGTLSPGINAGYLFTVTFPSNVSNQYQDQTSSVNFVFTASSIYSSGGGGASVPANGNEATVKQAAPTPVMAPAPVKGAIFTDVPESFWAYGDIENLSGLGYVSGYPDGAFRPNAPITRAEFCAIMDKVLNLTSYTQTPTFTDVNPGEWFYQAVEAAVQAGIARGEGSGVFDPNRLISRQEACTVLENCLGREAQALTDADTTTGFKDDAAISSWARGFVVLGFQDALIKGYPDDSFRPLNRATRAEACIMIKNFLGGSR